MRLWRGIFMERTQEGPWEITQTQVRTPLVKLHWKVVFDERGLGGSHELACSAQGLRRPKHLNPELLGYDRPRQGTLEEPGTRLLSFLNLPATQGCCKGQRKSTEFGFETLKFHFAISQWQNFGKVANHLHSVSLNFSFGNRMITSFFFFFTFYFILSIAN